MTTWESEKINIKTIKKKLSQNNKWKTVKFYILYMKIRNITISLLWYFKMNPEERIIL